MRYPRFVYALQHNVTKKIYIGSAADVKTRYNNHIWALRRGNHEVGNLQADFDRYGEDFSVYILEKIDYETRKHEYEWMRRYNSYNPKCGYNYKDNYFRFERMNFPLKPGEPTQNTEVLYDK